MGHATELEDSSSNSSSLLHASQLMTTSSGTEVDIEGEEEIEYVEEVVEYVTEETEEDDGDNGEQVTTSAAMDSHGQTGVEAVPAEQRSPATDAAKVDTPAIPPSTSAQELPKVGGPSTQTLQATKQPVAVDAPTDETTSSESPGTSGSTGAGAPVDLDFKQLEAQAAKVAKEVSQVALDVSSKLTAGLRSAFVGAEGSAKGAGASFSKLAGGLTSWWGSLDPAPQPARDETAERVASSNRASGELQELFGLSPEENLVEHFKCKLLQTYSCSHNPHTPAIQMAFQGTLYVTDRHTCFSVEERGRKVPFKVPHNLVVRATRQRPARKGDLSDVLKMELNNGQWLAFKDFDSGSALDSALALVEHLMEGS